MNGFQYDGPAVPTSTTKNIYRIAVYNNDKKGEGCSPQFYEGKLQVSVKIYDNSTGQMQTSFRTGGGTPWP